MFGCFWLQLYRHGSSCVGVNEQTSSNFSHFLQSGSANLGHAEEMAWRRCFQRSHGQSYSQSRSNRCQAARDQLKGAQSCSQSATLGTHSRRRCGSDTWKKYAKNGRRGVVENVRVGLLCGTFKKEMGWREGRVQRQLPCIYCGQLIHDDLPVCIYIHGIVLAYTGIAFIGSRVCHLS